LSGLSKQGRNSYGDSNDAADDKPAWPPDGRDGVSVRPVRHLQFHTWAGRLITTVAGYYILYRSWLLLARSEALAY
jgi:hypothetical protein